MGAQSYTSPLGNLVIPMEIMNMLFLSFLGYTQG